MSHWYKFYDNLATNNSHRIDPKNRGVVLLYNLFGNDSDICRTIQQEVMDADDGT